MTERKAEAELYIEKHDYGSKAEAEVYIEKHMDED